MLVFLRKFSHKCVFARNISHFAYRGIRPLVNVKKKKREKHNSDLATDKSRYFAQPGLIIDK